MLYHFCQNNLPLYEIKNSINLNNILLKFHKNTATCALIIELLYDYNLEVPINMHSNVGVLAHIHSIELDSHLELHSILVHFFGVCIHNTEVGSPEDSHSTEVQSPGDIQSIEVGSVDIHSNPFVFLMGTHYFHDMILCLALHYIVMMLPRVGSHSNDFPHVRSKETEVLHLGSHSHEVIHPHECSRSNEGRHFHECSCITEEHFLPAYSHELIDSHMIQPSSVDQLLIP